VPRSQEVKESRSGIIWGVIPFNALVIPAKAGVQSADGAFPKVCGVDSRLRGNDRGLGRPCRANDATTRSREVKKS
jgi:hypothetical protein